MFRDSRRSRTVFHGRAPLNQRGQILLETLLMAVFLAGFFSMLLAFTGQEHKRYDGATWSHGGRR